MKLVEKKIGDFYLLKQEMNFGMKLLLSDRALLIKSMQVN